MDNKTLEKKEIEELVNNQLKKMNISSAAIAAGLRKEIGEKRGVDPDKVTDGEVWGAMLHLSRGDLRKDLRSMGIMGMPTTLESVTPIHALRHLGAKGWRNKMAGLVGLVGWGATGTLAYITIAAQRAAKVVAEV